MVIDARRAGLSISDLLGFSPNSHQQPSVGFTDNSPEKKSVSSLGENSCSCMRRNTRLFKANMKAVTQIHYNLGLQKNISECTTC